MNKLSHGSYKDLVRQFNRVTNHDINVLSHYAWNRLTKTSTCSNCGMEIKFSCSRVTGIIHEQDYMYIVLAVNGVINIDKLPSCQEFLNIKTMDEALK